MRLLIRSLAALLLTLSLPLAAAPAPMHSQFLPPDDLTVRDAAPRGLSLEALAQSLRVDPLQLEEPVGALVALDWLGRLNEEGERYVVLVDPDTTPMAPLAERLLLARQASTLRFWDQSRWADLTLAQALTPGVLPPGAPPVVNA